jgi:multicomponent K+:H+ antiporter subunit G
MNHAAEVPLVVAIAVSALVVLGAAVTLIGSIGLLRLRTFYERVHAPTMGTTLGAALVAAASMLLFCTLESRPVVHEILITVFVAITAPVTFTLLVRAALHRDAAEGRDPTGGQAGPSESASATSRKT